MNFVFKKGNQTGYLNSHEPRQIGEIIYDYFSSSKQPLAVEYRKFLDSQVNSKKGGRA